MKSFFLVMYETGEETPKSVLIILSITIGLFILVYTLGMLNLFEHDSFKVVQIGLVGSITCILHLSFFLLCKAYYYFFRL